jgi:hypothetical protein
MRRFTSYLLAGVAGSILGAAAAGHAWVAAARVLREVALSEYIVEQEFLASRAHRNEQSFREALHLVNVADAQARLGFRWLERSRNATYWEWFWFPWESYSAIRQFEHPIDERHRRGRRMLEAQYRGAAALSLERIGESELATQEWNRALALNPSWSREDHQDFQQHRWASPLLGPEVESAYLDSTSESELASALAQVRQTLGAE